MKHHDSIYIPMPALSPEAAYVLADWLDAITHEIDLYYGDQFRSYLAFCGQEKGGIEREIRRLQEKDIERQQEFNF